MRIHITPDAGSFALRDTSDDQLIAAKPAGLWWAQDGDWAGYCRANSYHEKSYPNACEVEIRPMTHILKISTWADHKAFVETFGVRTGLAERPAHSSAHPWSLIARIDWRAVAGAFDGIEVDDLVAWLPDQAGSSRHGLTPAWLDTMQRWDIPSGCIWRPKDTVLRPLSREEYRTLIGETLTPPARKRTIRSR